ncbi:MAG: hypothetical protein BV459_03935 [Thermoplasmata archaeon M11B2D]|nr:MAG: hypothetical protein BV459_03935 [Thermoplasmata archaeon M11B2D]
MCRMQNTIFDNLRVIDNKGMTQEEMVKSFMETTYRGIRTINKTVVNILVDISKDFPIDVYHCIEWMAFVDMSKEVMFADDLIWITSPGDSSEVTIFVKEGEREREYLVLIEEK